MAKLKDIPFGSEIPTYDNDGFITLSSGLKGPSGSAIIETYSGSAFFIGEACYASCAHCANEASCAYYACEAGNAYNACCACEAGNAYYACCACEAFCACCACYACCACEAFCACCACCAGLAGEAFYLNYNGSLFVPSYCNSLSAYLLGVCQ